ncbi:MAG: response regulator [Ignavibacteriales bacterium]
MIYIIDDDQNIRDAFSILLKSVGYKCTLFLSAEDFLKNYSQSENDLLILDMNLIGINGCTLLENLEDKGIKLPVIVVTAFNDQRYRESCKKYGVLAYLRKPVDGEALIDLVKFNLDINLSSNNT